MADSVSSSTSTTGTGLATIQFGGVSSGLDTKGLIDALLQPETRRVANLQNQLTALADRKTAYGQLQTSLLDFLGKLQAFTMLKAGSSHVATSSDPTKLTAIATTAAAPGQYKIDVDHLATATVATSLAPIGTAITDTSALLSALPFAGSVKSGTLTIVVDNQIVTATVGDPTSTTLQNALDAISAAVQSKLGGDGTATASIVGNRLQLAIAGNASSHTLLIGAGSDTGNLFGLTGLTGKSATVLAGGGSVAGAYAAGVVRTTAALDAAGLSGLVSTTSGKLTINGAEISYDTTKDTLSTILTRINGSKAGVTASIDRSSDAIVITSKTAGAQPIVLSDSGSLLQALHLAPGTIDAQEIGDNALVYVNGKAVTSQTNQVSGAIDNVTLTLVAPTTTSATLTVDVDQTKIESALTDLVTGYNTLADQLDKLTLNDTKQAAGPLAGDLSARSLLSGLRSLLFSQLTGSTGSVRSLIDLGVTTGKVGSAVGTTMRLILDKDKLHKALVDDPAGVAQLLGPSGVLSSVVDRVKAWTDYNKILTSRTRSIDDQVRTLARDSVDASERLDSRRAMLEAKYAKMENTLSGLQQTLSSLTSQTAQMNK